MIDTARAYVAAGLSVIPIKTDGSKAPDLPAWRDYMHRLPTDQELTDWFGGELRGIGIIGGEISGRLEMLDFDQAGLAIDFQDVCRDAGIAAIFQKCVISKTPRNGHHAYYRVEGATGCQKLAHAVTEVSEDDDASVKPRLIGGKWYRVETLIETKGEGGYVIAPPTPKECHKLNRPYRLVHGSFDNIPVLTTGERDALHGIARTFGHPIPEVPARPRPSIYAPQRTGLSPGDDFAQRGDIEGLLRMHGWTPVGGDGWARPGKTTGRSATYGLGDDGRLMHVFSSNAHPFEAGETYSPLAIYAMLEHSGDLRAAARQLAADGYGDQSNYRQAA